MLLCLIMYMLLNFTGFCDTANILYVMPFTSKSHFIMLKPIGLELARRGHNVTVITGFRVMEPPPNYHQVVVDNKTIWDVISDKRPNVFTMVNLSDQQFHNDVLWKGGLAFTEAALNSSEVQTFLKDDNKYDLVINEQFYQEAMYVLSYKYQAPLILVTTFGNCMRHNILTGNPLQLSVLKSEFIYLKEPKSFLSRLKNLYFTFYEYVWWRYWYIGKHESLVRKYITNLSEPIPSLHEIQRNVSLMLVNRHFSFETSAAFLPNVIEIGGLHLTHSSEVIEKDLQSILDNAKQGVVYMSFGSNVQSSELPEDKFNAFLNVFRKFENYTVLWKWEDDRSKKNISDNIILRKWFPQKEIFGHPNTKLFISHGGLIGTQEAIYYGVPIVGIPIYGGQYNNLFHAQDSGSGKILQFNDINEELLEKTLAEVLHNTSYIDKAREMSRRYQDRPMSPLNTSIFWIEYILRHKGASFMKNPAIEMNWIDSNMLDVFAFVLFITAFFFYAVFHVFSILVFSKWTLKRKLRTENSSKKNH